MKIDGNYYDVLEINETASIEVIKAAYKALAKKYHPDSYKGSASERDKNMATINLAYEVLSDPQKRALYDQQISSNTTQNHNEYTEKESANSEDVESETEQFDCDVPDIGYDSREDSFGQKVGKFFNAVGKEILGEMQRNSQIVENAYLDGLVMDEYLLVRRFKQAKGYQRAGFAKAMEEKGLLI